MAEVMRSEEDRDATVIVLDGAEVDALGRLLNEFGMIPAHDEDDRWAVDEEYKVLKELVFLMIGDWPLPAPGSGWHPDDEPEDSQEDML